MFTKNNNPQRPLQLRIRPNEDDAKLMFPQVFTQPKNLGCFSIVDGPMRNYEHSASQLRYYRKPNKFPLDLNKGLNLAIKRPESSYDEKLDHLLKFIYDEHEKSLKPPPGGDAGSLLGADVICWSGLLRIIMCTPYEPRQDWCIHVIRYMGTLYLHKVDTDNEKQKRAQKTEIQKTTAAWGSKFEQYCLTNSPFIEPDTNLAVDECSKSVCVFRTHLNSFTMLYGCEMGGIFSDQLLPPDNVIVENLKFVDLKVLQNNLKERQYQNYKRFLTCHWWCQSFLVAVEDIFVGLHNDNGIVDKIDHLKVRQLPKQSDLWTPSVCANFLDQFLREIKKLTAEVNCPYTTYELRFNAKTALITYECFKGPSVHSFLPSWYVALLKRKI